MTDRVENRSRIAGRRLFAGDAWINGRSGTLRARPQKAARYGCQGDPIGSGAQGQSLSVVAGRLAAGPDAEGEVLDRNAVALLGQVSDGFCHVSRRSRGAPSIGGYDRPRRSASSVRLVTSAQGLISVGCSRPVRFSQATGTPTAVAPATSLESESPT